MGSRLFSIAVTLFWVCMMCSLVAQRIVPYHRRAQAMLIEPEILALQWTDIAEWNWIKNDGQTVGASFLRITQDPVGPEQELGTAPYRVYQALDLTAPILGFSQNVRVNLAMNLTPEFNVDDFAARIRVSPFSFRVEGFVQDEGLYFRLIQDRQDPLYRVLPLKRAPNLLSAVEPMMARHSDLKRGESYSVDVVDPIANMGTQQVTVKGIGPEEIQIDGKTIPAFRIDTVVGDIVKSRWVDDKGRTLRGELVSGLFTQVASRIEVLALFPQLDPDLEESLRVPALDRQEFLDLTRGQEVQTPPDSGAMLGVLEGFMR